MATRLMNNACFERWAATECRPYSYPPGDLTIRRRRCWRRLLNVTRQQFTFKYCDLSVNHSVQVRFSAASKSKVLAVFASALGCVAFSSVPMSTSSAAADSSPDRQIISASALIVSVWVNQ